MITAEVRKKPMPTDKVQVAAYVDAQLKARLDRWAKYEERSISYLVTKLLAEKLDQVEKEIPQLSNQPPATPPVQTVETNHTESKVLAALKTGAKTEAELVTITGLTQRHVAKLTHKLCVSGLVVIDGATKKYRLVGGE